jgi:hypothetical protein
MYLQVFTACGIKDCVIEIEHKNFRWLARKITLIYKTESKTNNKTVTKMKQKLKFCFKTGTENKTGKKCENVKKL